MAEGDAAQVRGSSTRTSLGSSSPLRRLRSPRRDSRRVRSSSLPRKAEGRNTSWHLFRWPQSVDRPNRSPRRAIWKKPPEDVAGTSSSSSSSSLDDQLVRDDPLVVFMPEPRSLPKARRAAWSPTPSRTTLEANEKCPLPFCHTDTTILQLSHLDYVCRSLHCPQSAVRHQARPVRAAAQSSLVDSVDLDSPVQESVECLFASQLPAGGLPRLLQDEPLPDLTAPSSMQQSLFWKRSLVCRSSSSMSSTRKSVRSAQITQVSVPVADQAVALAPPPCACSRQATPVQDPATWPQRPLLLRPTLNSGTIIKGVRYASSLPGDSSTSGWAHPTCPHCQILPINNGNEKPGQCLVIDFESELFDGTLLLRIRHANGTTSEPYNDDHGYFAGMNRRYQAVIQGRFKKAIPWVECQTGFQLQRPCGKLPPKWIIKSVLKMLSFFAPQLEAKWECSQPSTLTPLGSTPQYIRVQKDGEQELDLEQVHEEPLLDTETLLGEASDALCTLQRSRFRKKKFGKLYAAGDRSLLTDPSKVYTMEFLQHLFDFHDFSMDLGSFLGSHKLKDLLDGQPLQVMAMWKNAKIWSFDIWHECLLEDSKRFDAP
jgi:Protein of unknown function (DUF1769)